MTTDRGTGWLVSQGGLWVPVAYNASVEESAGSIGAAFTALSGYRHVASRGRGHKSWKVSETVFAEWAQMIQALYESPEGLRALYWVPPISGMTNILPDLTIPNESGKMNNLGISIDSEGKLKTTYSITAKQAVYRSPYFPVRFDAPMYFGANYSYGPIEIEYYSGIGTSAISDAYIGNPNNDEPGWREDELTVPQGARWARLIIDPAKSPVIASPYCRMYQTQGVNVGSTKGSWVTLDSLAIGHDKISPHDPLVDVDFEMSGVIL